MFNELGKALMYDPRGPISPIYTFQIILYTLRNIMRTGMAQIVYIS